VTTKAKKKDSEKKQWFTAYKKYVTDRDIEPSAESLQEWDQKHNRSRIKHSFGSQQDVYRAGLIFLYRQFLYNFSLLKVRGTSISGIRRLSSDGTKGFISNASAAEIDFAKSRLQSNLRADSERLLILNMKWEDIRALVEEQLEEIEREARQQPQAAKAAAAMASA
jgi:hypothetical protein